MRIDMTILKAAKAQIREARENGELEDFDIDTPREKEILDEEALYEVRCSNAKNRHNREYDWDAMQEVVNARQESKGDFVETKRAYRKKNQQTAIENNECRVEWNFPAGTLVTIKEPTRALRFGRNLEYLGLTPGDTGVVVETEDSPFGGRQRGRWVQVLGPQGLQDWDATWLTVE